jgi:ABC-type antimicrobial peptide transport system permease subunit
MAWRNLSTKKLRSSLTILGVVIGIGAIFFLFSLGLGLQNLVTKEVIGNKSIRSVDIASPNSRIVKLDRQSIDKISNLSQVDKLGVSYSFAGSLTFRQSEIDAITYGIDTKFQELSNFELTHGRLLKQDDVNSAFVNTALLSAIGITDTSRIIDQKLELTIPLPNGQGNKTELRQLFTVVGVINTGSGSEVFIPSILLDQAGVQQYTQTKLIAKEDATISDLRSQIESLGFETTSPIDTIDQINQIFKYFNVVLVGFGAIGMIVAVLGMFNTLTISLLERTKEIGLMVALGGRNKDMRLLFILEAVLLSLIGSMIGIAFAVVIGKIVNMLMNSIAASRGVSDNFILFSTPIWLVLALVGFMVLVGVLVVLLPARRAARINPIDALRRE